MSKEKPQKQSVEYSAVKGIVGVMHQGDKCIQVEDSLRDTVSRRI